MRSFAYDWSTGCQKIANCELGSREVSNLHTNPPILIDDLFDYDLHAVLREVPETAKSTGRSQRPTDPRPQNL